MKIYCILLALSLAVAGQENGGQMVGKAENNSTSDDFCCISSPPHQTASVWTPR